MTLKVILFFDLQSDLISAFITTRGMYLIALERF
jgi:hypothetical protein